MLQALPLVSQRYQYNTQYTNTVLHNTRWCSKQYINILLRNQYRWCSKPYAYTDLPYIFVNELQYLDAYSMLDIACRRGLVDTIKYIITFYDLNVNILSNIVKTLMYYAKIISDDDMMSIMQCIHNKYSKLVIDNNILHDVICTKLSYRVIKYMLKFVRYDENSHRLNVLLTSILDRNKIRIFKLIIRSTSAKAIKLQDLADYINKYTTVKLVNYMTRVGMRCSSNECALYNACKSANLNMMRYFITRCTNIIDYEHEDGHHTMLHVLVKKYENYGYLKSNAQIVDGIKLLLNHCIKLHGEQATREFVNETRHNVKTIIDYALKASRPIEVLQLLVEYGAKTGPNSLCYACKEYTLSVPNYPLHSVNDYNRTQHDTLNIIKYIYGNSTTVCNPLINAIGTNKSLEVIQYLLSIDSIMDNTIACASNSLNIMRSAIVNTPLETIKYIHRVIYNNRSLIDCIGIIPKILFPCDLSLNTIWYLMECIRNDERYNKIVNKMLLRACRYCADFDVIKYLVEECGADVNVKRRKNGKTPLTYACKNMPRLRCAVKYLLDHGANASTGGTVTPLMYACYRYCNKIVRMLARHTRLNIISTRDLIAVCNNCSLGTIKYIVKRYRVHDIDLYYDRDMITPLFHVCRYGGTLDVVKYLIELGSNVHLIDSRGNNILYYANNNQCHSVEIIEYLLNNFKFDLYHTNNNNNTVIHDLSQYDKYQHIIWNMVTKHGLDMNKINSIKPVRDIILKYCIDKKMITYQVTIPNNYTI